MPDPGHHRSDTMSDKTCAVCDYVLDENAIEVKVAGRAVEVCCEECAVKLRESVASAGGYREASARP
jgi:hypothetical protein